MWRNDPSAFPWDKQTLEWQQLMRILSFMVWHIELQAPKAAWGTDDKKAANGNTSPLILPDGYGQ